LLFGQHIGSPDPSPSSPTKSVGRITILAKTNREQTLVVHALFGKGNLRNLDPPTGTAWLSAYRASPVAPELGREISTAIAKGATFDPPIR
jgi:hypothetical protein